MTDKQAFSRSGLADKDQELMFSKELENVREISCGNQREFDKITSKITDHLKSSGTAFTEIIEALKDIRSVIMHLSEFKGKMHVFINNMSMLLSINLKHLRFQVVRETCLTIALMCRELKNNVEAHACEIIMRQLMSNVMSSVKVISSASYTALKFMFKYVNHSKLINTLVEIFFNSKFGKVRTASCELLDLILQGWPVNKIVQHIPSIEKVIIEGLEMPTEECRMASRKLFSEFVKCFPEEGKALLNQTHALYRKNALVMKQKSSHNVTSASRQVSTTSLPGGISTEHTLPSMQPLAAVTDYEDNAIALPEEECEIVEDYFSDIKLDPTQQNAEHTLPSMQPLDAVTDYEDNAIALPEEEYEIVEDHFSDIKLDPTQQNAEHTLPSMQPLAAVPDYEDNAIALPEEEYEIVDHFSDIKLDPTQQNVSTITPISCLPVTSTYIQPGCYEIPLAIPGTGQTKLTNTRFKLSPAILDESEGEGKSIVVNVPRFRENVSKIIANCESTDWTVRLMGLIALRSCLRRGVNKLNLAELHHITDIFTQQFDERIHKDTTDKGATRKNTSYVAIKEAKTEREVFISFFESLNALIRNYKGDLNFWLLDLMTSLLSKLGVDLPTPIHDRIFKTLAVVRESFPPDHQMLCVMRFVTELTNKSHHRVKIEALNFIINLTEIIDPFQLTSPSAGQDYVKGALRKIIDWTIGNKPKQNIELRLTAQNAIRALFDIESPQLKIILAKLPEKYNDAVARLMLLGPRRCSARYGGRTTNT